ncbi:hypothetical protein JST97_16945 [bacterium]|nr:hypothetical protein [bacterium]
MLFCAAVVVCSSLSELRQALEKQLGFALQESRRPDLADFVGPRLTNIKVSDGELFALGKLGQQGRAGLASRLATALGAQLKTVDDFRPLWLELECVLYRGLDHPLGKRALKRAWQGLEAIYAKEALAGREQAALGYPRLAQWALLAGGLENACKTSA